MTLAEALEHDVYQTKRELASKMRVTTREVEHQIEQARKNRRLPIMSGPDGYRLARDPDEYALNVDRRHKRALVQLVTVSNEKAMLDEWRIRIGQKPRPAPKPVADQAALPW